MSKLNAGRELDAEIAEKVMGRKIYIRNNQPSYKDQFEHTPIPYYSTDIAAAMEVLKKLSNIKGYLIRLSTYKCWAGDSRWSADFTAGFAVAETAPLAICRAALKAVGHE